MTDRELSRRLTDAVRAVDGVAGLFPVQPVKEVAAAVVSSRPPEVGVEIEVDDDLTVVTAHVSASSDRPAPETLRAVGDLLRATLDDEGVPHDAVQVIVQVKVVDGI